MHIARPPQGSCRGPSVCRRIIHLRARARTLGVGAPCPTTSYKNPPVCKESGRVIAAPLGKGSGW